MVAVAVHAGHGLRDEIAARMVLPGQDRLREEDRGTDQWAARFPTHLVAAAGATTLALLSGESDPALCAPRGRRAEVLRAAQLSDLSTATVQAAAELMIRGAGDTGAA